MVRYQIFVIGFRWLGVICFGTNLSPLIPQHMNKPGANEGGGPNDS